MTLVGQNTQYEVVTLEPVRTLDFFYMNENIYFSYNIIIFETIFHLNCISYGWIDSLNVSLSLFNQSYIFQHIHSY